jgi:hypothetical protein
MHTRFRVPLFILYCHKHLQVARDQVSELSPTRPVLFHPRRNLMYTTKRGNHILPTAMTGGRPVCICQPGVHPQEIVPVPLLNNHYYSVLLIIRDNAGGGGRCTDNPNFIFYTPTTPLATHRLKKCSSHTLPITCVLTCAPRDESHQDISAFMNQTFCIYVYSA